MDSESTDDGRTEVYQPWTGSRLEAITEIQDLHKDVSLSAIEELLDEMTKNGRCTICEITNSFSLIQGHLKFPTWQHLKNSTCQNCRMLAAVVRKLVAGTALKLHDSTYLFMSPSVIKKPEQWVCEDIHVVNGNKLIVGQFCAAACAKSIHATEEALTILKLTFPKPRRYAGLPTFTKQRIWDIISESTGSHESVAWAMQKLRMCEASHDCGPISKLAVGPKRMLDLTGLHKTNVSGQVKVVDCFKRHSRYACVSYCWGRAPFRKLTTRNLRMAMTRGMPLRSFPRALREVITFARRMGIHNLWIDAWCIVQDCEEDKTDQIGRMREIFGNAILTFAIARSVAANDACFSQPHTKYRGIHMDDDPVLREWLPGIQVRAALRHPGSVTTIGDSHQSVEYPLQRRAWAFQEALLSVRVLTFADEELIWDCLQWQDCQCGAVAISSTQGEIRLSLHSEANSEGFYHNFDMWQNLVTMYSRQYLTYESDREAAFRGIEARFEDCLGRGISGVWLSLLHQSLLWRAESDQEIIRYMSGSIYDMSARLPENDIWSKEMLSIGGRRSMRQAMLAAARVQGAGEDSERPSWSWLSACRPGHRVIRWANVGYNTHLAELNICQSTPDGGYDTIVAQSHVTLFGWTDLQNLSCDLEAGWQTDFFADHSSSTASVQAVLLPLDNHRVPSGIHSNRQLVACVVLIENLESHKYHRVGFARLTGPAQADIRNLSACTQGKREFRIV